MKQRKVVTVLFCDVTGSTELGESVDPEALQVLLARYFERMKDIVESHGGTVEKFIGDAVMAVFAVPQVHEDDALRAVRAAVEMRDALPELGVQARIGVNTGEVVTGTEERLATGDAVNVAARLEQAASPGEILIGEETFGLVQEAVEAKEVPPLELKGKVEPVAAYRLLAVATGAPERVHAMRFVGRNEEIALIRAAWQRAAEERACQLVTIVGEAGVGKSRLVAEALESIAAPVVRGRCLSYGEGITYWPVVEVVRQLDSLPTDEDAARGIRSLLGESEQVTSSSEIAWAVRKLLEERAPLVTVFDDIQWGEETFLDLVEHVALFAGSPLLLVCMARPELVESRPEWPVSLRLEPLPSAQIVELIPGNFEDELRERIEHASGGNPLFVQEMVEMAGDAEGEVAVPPNLQALLAARLDQLEAGERSVLERGAIEGEIFHRGSVQALSQGQVTPRLAALVRKALVRPDRSLLAGDDAFRFRHLLIRDAAYDALPKAERAELHERFALWLEEHGTDLVELDEILGYHLEQAVRYRRELGQEPEARLVSDARKRLKQAGSRAQYLRQDHAGARSLLERAAALSPDELDLDVEVDLLWSIFWMGRVDDARLRARGIVARARDQHDRIGELFGLLGETWAGTSVDPEGATEELERLLGEAVPEFERADNGPALMLAFECLAQVANVQGRPDDMLDSHDQYALKAVELGRPLAPVGWRSAALFYGTTCASEMVAWHDAQLAAGATETNLRIHRAVGRAMLGRVDEARAEISAGVARTRELGNMLEYANLSGQPVVEFELLAGDPRAAAAAGEEGMRVYEELGERAFASTAAGRLAEAYYELDRLDEAGAMADRAAELGAADDATTQILWRQVKAKVLARRGEVEQAEGLAREAVAIGDETQILNDQASAYFDLATVLELAGKDPRPALEEALARYERKENLIMAERVRERLGELVA